MSGILESTYKIIKKIGHGGGSNVYLAIHLRLGKKVVLKADKRKITTRPELLRREVDILKNLRHTYIPQVYDFFIENGIVYTVMDYIEGESLNVPLKRGERFSQPQVISWAIQLLEALAYLHSPTHGDPPRGFVHSDIKPANLMRTPDNSICLIDFNIALALGEENVVGRSPGYSSPEHYGPGYSQKVISKEEIEETDEKTDDETETMDAETEAMGASQQSKTVYRKFIPDVRSDIYSVGATLYHLLSGHRPAEYPKKVEPLSDDEFSPQVVEIITKAMNPNPDLRYQSAEEMLNAFLHLRDKDPRVKRLKRRGRIACAAVVVLFCLGLSVGFVGLKRMQEEERVLNLAARSESALAKGDVDLALQYALDAIPEDKNIFTPEKTAEVQNALTDALGVYDLADGFKTGGIIDLEKNPLYLSVSPDGQTAACIYEKNAAIIDIETAEVIAVLPAIDSALAEIEYLNNDTVIYAGEDGITAYSISERRAVWNGAPATAITVAPGGNIAAAVYKDDSRAVLYDASTGEQIGEVDFGGRSQKVSMVSDSFANPDNNLFEISSDGSLLAASFSDGSLGIFCLSDDEDELKILDEGSGYSWFEGGFSGNYLAFAAADSDTSIFAIIDAEGRRQTAGMESESSFHVQTDENGIYVQVNQILVKMDPVTGDQTPLVTTDKMIDQFVVSDNYSAVSADGQLFFFDKNADLISEAEDMGNVSILKSAGDTVLTGQIDTPEICVLRYEENSTNEILTYDASFDHDEARISADEQSVMLFSYKQFRICDMEGNVIAEQSLPDPENVYDQQYVRTGDESWLEVTYSDGKVMTYSGENGELISESTTEPPDMTLDEVFYTDDYRIEARLHDSPQVYDAESGQKICELSEDAYLTYVTQAGENIITQYVTADGYCYGVLLDEDCQTLAYLPYLSDVMGDELYFDYPSGSIRKSVIYDLNSLIEMGKEEMRKQDVIS